jgi:hypothetical protein
LRFLLSSEYRLSLSFPIAHSAIPDLALYSPEAEAGETVRAGSLTRLSAGSLIASRMQRGNSSMKQSMRDVVTGELSLEYFARRFADGWKVRSIEWFRESGETSVLTPSSNLLDEREAIPYGLRITEAGIVQENPLEATVLLLILDQIVREKRIQEIANELNLHGYSTREGLPWGPTDVFNLLPRLIEAAPSLLKSVAWQQRRPSLQKTAEKAN